jgi:LPXTG-motif cell wall-anchored protein
MTPNLSVYWDTIKLKYEKSTDVWVDFDSPESEYSYTLTYDAPTNTLIFLVPDSLHIIIDYTTLITENGLVSVENSVEVGGKAQVADVISAYFRVQEHSGGASGSNNEITLLKQDGLTNVPLPNATFLLYGPMGDPSAIPPSGASKNIITNDGKILRYIGAYTTGSNGTSVIETQYLTVGGPYALVEQVAPQGYELLKKPVYFYFYDQDPNGIIQSVTTLIAIENFSGIFVIPETGGTGTFYMVIIGIVLVTLPIVYKIIRRKRERRLKN